MSDCERSKSGRVISTFTKRVSVTRDSSGDSSGAVERTDGSRDETERAEVPSGIVAPQLPKSGAFGPRTLSVTNRDERLSITPFAVLLPRRGSIAVLQQFKNHLGKCYQEISAASDTTEEGARARKSEELMLSQVLKWLNLDSEVESE